MTSANDHPNTALLIVDMQQDVVAQGHDVDQVVANINTLLDKARTANVPVVWVQHSDDGMPRDSEGWHLIPALARQEDESLVEKHYGDSFADTNLQSLLDEHRVGHIVVTGAQTDACIRSTLHGGLVRGYDVTLVADAHTTEDMREWGSPIDPEQAIAYTNMYWQFSQTADSKGNTLPAADIEFTAAASVE